MGTISKRARIKRGGDMAVTLMFNSSTDPDALVKLGVTSRVKLNGRIHWVSEPASSPKRRRDR